MPTVPVLSMVGMVFSLILSVGVPIVLLVLLKKRTNARLSSAIYGALTFIVFALILESLLHRLMFSVFGDRLTGNIWLYALYGGLAAGLFEESGRYLTMKYFMKRQLDRDNALMYGVGHGGIEAILLIGLTGVSNLAASLMINSGAMEASLSTLDEATRAATETQLAALGATPSGMFFLGGVERIAAIALHIALSYLVFRAVKESRSSLWLLAVAIHAGIDAATVLLAQLLSPLWVELVLLALVALLWAWIRPQLRAEEPDAAPDDPA